MKVRDLIIILAQLPGSADICVMPPHSDDVYDISLPVGRVTNWIVNGLSPWCLLLEEKMRQENTELEFYPNVGTLSTIDFHPNVEYLKEE